MSFKIIRFRFNGKNTTIKKGLSLEEAQEHCQDPETSGSTCSDLSSYHKVNTNTTIW